jgi:putative sporulation protein YyaC
VVTLPENTVYYDSSESLVQWKLNETLYRLINESGKTGGISIICIGTDRSTGDSYGPLTGHMLSKINFCDFDLYGTFKEPVHALTLPKTLERIDLEHSLIIAVDASVGAPDYVGHIGMGLEPIKPGSGLGKELPPVGDISITGIAAAGGFAPFLMLQNASLGLIYNMAEKTFFAIQAALYRLRLEQRLPACKKELPVRNARA